MTRANLFMTVLIVTVAAGCSLSVEPRPESSSDDDVPPIADRAADDDDPLPPDTPPLEETIDVSARTAVVVDTRCREGAEPYRGGCIRWEGILDLFGCRTHTATRLDDGRVRIEGDCWIACFPAGRAFFDPGSNSIDPDVTAPTVEIGADATATELRDGRVLAIDERGVHIGTREPRSSQRDAVDQQEIR